MELAPYAETGSVQTAYIGGGSPTALPHEQLLALVTQIQQTWPYLTEFTVECNPGQVSPELFQQLHDNGVNRLSLGAQSLHEHELQWLGRRHDVREIRNAVQWAKDAGFDNLSIDLIFGIPGSTLTSWTDCLNEALDLGVQHLSTYSLTYEPDTPLDASRQCGDIEPVEEALDRAMYEAVLNILSQAGFEHYEISNFARPGFACQHNLGYWHNRPYIGVGPAAASNWQEQRTLNTPDIEVYCQAIEQGQCALAECEAIDDEAHTCETAVLNLRLRRGIDLKRFQQQTGCKADDVFAREIAYHQQHNNLTVTDQGIALTEQALPIADRVLCDFARF